MLPVSIKLILCNLSLNTPHLLNQLWFNKAVYTDTPTNNMEKQTMLLGTIACHCCIQWYWYTDIKISNTRCRISWARLEKTVFVRRGNKREFININHLADSFSIHPALSTIPHPVALIVALYVLGGIDFVSSFFRCLKKHSWESS